MYSLPSTSMILEPLPLSKNSGLPPTDPHALAGLLTPPGMIEVATSVKALRVGGFHSLS